MDLGVKGFAGKWVINRVTGSRGLCTKEEYYGWCEVTWVDGWDGPIRTARLKLDDDQTDEFEKKKGGQ